MNENIIENLKQKKETVWINENRRTGLTQRDRICGHGFIEMRAAQERLLRFMPFFEEAFPETAAKKGLIESELLLIPKLQQYIAEQNGKAEKADGGAESAGPVVCLKDDAHLPIAGSVKARGGIHEVLKRAEGLAFKENLLKCNGNYRKLASPRFRQFFSDYTIQVGSTGNLGLSIGISAAALGFHAVVHMSRDAKEWKKQLLREKGVQVMEYDGDYSRAVAMGRAASAEDSKSFFVDDENSQDLFFGYSSVGLRLFMQLRLKHRAVDAEHPLFVYLPCGVGGAPGGIMFGLKEMFGDNVHCFIAEPTGAPCMTLSLASGKGAEICVQDIGLDGRTEADGLAVGRPSAFAYGMMRELASGAFTVSDEQLLKDMRELYAKEGIFVEPSAAAGFIGLRTMLTAADGCGDGENLAACRQYLEENGLLDKMDRATHIVWATGGGLVPEAEKKKYLGTE